MCRALHQLRKRANRLEDRKLSEYEGEEREQVLAYVKGRWNQYYTAAREARKDAANFIAAINGGGAVAVLAFAGAILKEGSALAKALPLRLGICFFVAGVVSSALAHAVENTRLSGLFTKWRAAVDKFYSDTLGFDSMYQEDVKRSSANQVIAVFLIWVAFGCFAIGALLGASLLLYGE